MNLEKKKKEKRQEKTISQSVNVQQGQNSQLRSSSL